MTRFTPDVSNVGYGREATRATSVAPTFWVPDTEFAFDDKVGKVMNQSSFGDINHNNNAHIIKQWADGTAKGIVYRNSFGLILGALFGQVDTPTTVTAGVYSHAYTLANNNQHLSLTIVRKDPQLNLRFALALLDQLTINVVVDKYINYEAKFMSKLGVTGSDTPSYATGDTEFIPKHATIRTAAVGTTNLAGASNITNIKSVTLTLKKNLKETQALGNVGLENIVNTDFEVTGKIERYYDDTTFKTTAFSNTHQSLRVGFVDTDTTLAGGNNPTLNFDMDEVIFNDWSETSTDGDAVVETVNFTALRNATSAASLIATLINTTATY